MPPTKILIYGTGAVGTIYAYLLTKSDCHVTAICRSNYTAAKSQGFHINSDVYGRDLHVAPNIVRSAEEAASEGIIYDFVLVACKALPEAKTAEKIAPAVTPGKTTIVLLQNGIDIEEEYAKAYPDNPLLTCVVYLPVTQTSPGHISHGNISRLEIGPYPSTPATDWPSDQAQDLMLLLDYSGGNPIWHGSTIQERRWYKLILNAPWNPICALTLCRDTAFLASSPPDISDSVIQGVVSEIIDISRALGYKSINEAASLESLNRIKGRMGKGKGVEPSMLVDVLYSRRTEHEVILGNVVRKARELGVQVPRLELLYALVKGLDAALQRRERDGESLSGENLG